MRLVRSSLPPSPASATTGISPSLGQTFSSSEQHGWLPLGELALGNAVLPASSAVMGSKSRGFGIKHIIGFVTAVDKLFS